MRGYKGGSRERLRELARLMRENDDRDHTEVYEAMERLMDAT